MNPDPTLALTENCPKDGVHLYFHQDPETNLDYMHARYYSPWMGRFLSVDPLQRRSATMKPQTWNKYAYARNNPMKFVDPNGLEEINLPTLDSDQPSDGGSAFILWD